MTVRPLQSAWRFSRNEPPGNPGRFMYMVGQGVPRDYAEAARWFRKAADQGDDFGQFNLGVLYAHGQGVPRDYTEAVRWYRRAADLDFVPAFVNLGIMYEDGSGVPQDYPEAMRRYRKAADQGEPRARVTGLPGGDTVVPQGRRTCLYPLPGESRSHLRHRPWRSAGFRRGGYVVPQGCRAWRCPSPVGAGIHVCHRPGCAAGLRAGTPMIQPGRPRFSASEAEDRMNALRHRDRVAAKMPEAQIAEATRLAREWKPK